MGVELGKVLAMKIIPELEEKLKILHHDSSTNNLIRYYRNQDFLLPPPDSCQPA